MAHTMQLLACLSNGHILIALALHLFVRLLVILPSSLLLLVALLRLIFPLQLPPPPQPQPIGRPLYRVDQNHHHREFDKRKNQEAYRRPQDSPTHPNLREKTRRKKENQNGTEEDGKYERDIVSHKIHSSNAVLHALFHPRSISISIQTYRRPIYAAFVCALFCDLYLDVFDKRSKRWNHFPVPVPTTSSHRAVGGFRST